MRRHAQPIPQSASQQNKRVRVDGPTIPTAPSSASVEVSCRCGSKTHSRVTHQGCPFNPRRNESIIHNTLTNITKRERELLLEAYTFELAQGYKAKLLGNRMKHMHFRFPYFHYISVDELHEIAIRNFGADQQLKAFEFEEVLQELGRQKDLPWMVIDIIRNFTFGSGIVGKQATLWDPSKHNDISSSSVNPLFDPYLKEEQAFGQVLKRYCRKPVVFKKGVRSKYELKLQVPLLAQGDRRKIIKRIQEIEGPNFNAKLKRVRKTLNIDAVDMTKPHSMIIRVERKRQFMREDIGMLKVPNNGSVNFLLAAIQQKLLPLHDSNTRCVLRIYKEKHHMIRGKTVLRVPLPTRDSCGFFSGSTNMLDINGGEDPTIVTNVWSNGNMRWIPDKSKHKDETKLPRFRCKIHGGRDKLLSYIQERGLKEQMDDRIIISVSCSIQDVLPTLTESKLPGVTPMTELGPDSGYSLLKSLPSVIATLEYDDVGYDISRYDISVVGVCARLPDNKYPERVSNDKRSSTVPPLW